MNRRDFSMRSSMAMAAWMTRKLWAEQVVPCSSADKFYIAILTDIHMIDAEYKGPENTAEDTNSLYHSEERLLSARALINSLLPRIEQTFLIGDLFHNYPSKEYSYYFERETRIDKAKSMLDGFQMPVHLAFGNHDYDVKFIPREMSHKLFAAKFNAKPYSSFDYKGWKFLMLNNFLGATQDVKSEAFNTAVGSFGEEQLHWIEAQLKEGKPTFVFLHYPLTMIDGNEMGDYGLFSLLQKYKQTIKVVLSGHQHRWLDLGHTWGPRHLVVASTRYDVNAYMLVEIATRDESWRFLNEDLVGWATHFAQPYRGMKRT